jgi:hypothetical protein
MAPRSVSGSLTYPALPHIQTALIFSSRLAQILGTLRVSGNGRALYPSELLAQQPLNNFLSTVVLLCLRYYGNKNYGLASEVKSRGFPTTCIRAPYGLTSGASNQESKNLIRTAMLSLTSTSSREHFGQKHSIQP